MAENREKSEREDIMYHPIGKTTQKRPKNSRFKPKTSSFFLTQTVSVLILVTFIGLTKTLLDGREKNLIGYPIYIQ
jgi:hypothetical protein